MCGASTFASDWTMTGPCRQLLRNISSNSSYANNHPRDDTAAEDDRQQQTASSDVGDISYGDGMSIGAACTSSVVSLRSSPCVSFDSMQPHVHNMPVTQPEQHAQADCPQLLLGTNAGLVQLDLATLAVQRLGLTAVPVGHVSYSSCGLVLAACPVFEETCCGGSPQAVAEAKEAAGLYCLNLKQRRSCDSSSPSSFGGISCDLPVLKLWHGGATCCAFAPVSDNEQAVPRIYCGTQPADLIYSDDLGGSWASCDLSEAPQADSWFRRLPPYEPSVRAINFAGSQPPASSAAAAAGASIDGQQQPNLLVAVEVGGVLSSCQPSVQQDSEGWTDCSQALCRDVHALQSDPFNPRCLYAVAGSGHLPGGLYRCKGKGQKWKRLFGYRYSVGMAISAYQKGRMLLVSADKPPATGCILFESVDAGRSWVNISDDVADAAALLTEHSPEVFEQAPLAMFVPGGLILSCASGHILHGTAKPLGGFSNWKLLATLPAAVNCMCSTDAAVAPVSIQRS